MLQEMDHLQNQQLSIEDINHNHMLEFSESELFPETTTTTTTSMQNSESNCSNNTYEYDHSKHYDQIQHQQLLVSNEIIMPPPPPSITNMQVLDDDHDDISVAIDFTTSPTHHHQYHNNNNNSNEEASFDMISSLSINIPNILPSNGGSSSYSVADRWSAQHPTSNYEDESSFIRLKPTPTLAPTCSILDSCMMLHPYLPPTPLSINNETLTSSSPTPPFHLPPDHIHSHQDLEFQTDNTTFFLSDHHNMHTSLFNFSTDALQGLGSNENCSQHHLYNGGGAATSTTSGLATAEISTLEDPTFKVGKLSVEERKRKIHRYKKKRNERNFSKKIKYACRKTLADSRPRVRGRFAKNDELGEVGRHMENNHEDEVEEDVVPLYSNSITDHHQTKVVVKEEDDHLDSSDILAHISGVNSFKCNYPIQSWI